MADDNVLDQNEIERLLSGIGGGDSPPPEPPAPAAASPEPDDGGLLGQAELDALFASSGKAVSGPNAPAAGSSAGPLHQSDIESLFQGTAASAPPSPVQGVSPAAPPPKAPSAPHPMPFAVHADSPDEDGIQQGDLDYLLKRAGDAINSLASVKMDLPAEVIEFQFPEFGGSVPNTEHATLDQISEVELDVKIELGRTNMYLEDILKLRKGAVVPLDKMAGDAVDVYVNGRLLARGEVLVMNENFCVRVAELLAGAIPME